MATGLRYPGKVVIVTGGTRGIGEAIVTEFVHQGAKVVFCAPECEEEQGKAIVQKLEYCGAPGEAYFQICDVRCERAIQNLVAVTIELYGCLDCLVNNVGVLPGEVSCLAVTVVSAVTGGKSSCLAATCREGASITVSTEITGDAGCSEGCSGFGALEATDAEAFEAVDIAALGLFCAAFLGCRGSASVEGPTDVVVGALDVEVAVEGLDTVADVDADADDAGTGANACWYSRYRSRCARFLRDCAVSA
nr:uncharacterized protein LOC132779499 [Anolis sagrei ordinatus]